MQGDREVTALYRLPVDFKNPADFAYTHKVAMN